jgi:hypothetical protein
MHGVFSSVSIRLTKPRREGKDAKRRAAFGAGHLAFAGDKVT